MRPLCLILLLAFSETHLSDAQPATSPQPPQTARQALLDMITGSPETFTKHLPEATRKTLLQGEGSADSPILRQFAAFNAAMAANRNDVQTFAEGTTLLAMNEDNGLHKMEINVERDDLMSDVDEIELSFHSYKEGMVEPLPVIPRLTLSMKQEKEVWKLDEITLALRVPVGDAEFLKGLRKSQNAASESSAVAGLRTLNTAEISYAASFPEKGYTCQLSTLAGAGVGKDPNAEHAMLIDEVLASGKKGGYIFSINGCDSRPASKYQTTAVPSDLESGSRAFCSDETATVRYAADGKAASCLSAGVPLQ
jgi:hypothetical protein